MVKVLVLWQTYSLTNKFRPMNTQSCFKQLNTIYLSKLEKHNRDLVLAALLKMVQGTDL